MNAKQKNRSHRCLKLEYADFISIFDEFDEGVIFSDHTGVILYYNDTMAKIDDLISTIAIGKKVTDVYDLNREEQGGNKYE